MTPPDAAEGTRRCPGLAGLAILRERGWIFLALGDGGLDAIVGTSERSDVTEQLLVRAEDDAIAVRMLTADYLQARRGRAPGVLWSYAGTVQDTVSELLALPRHGASTAPRLVRAAPGDLLWTPPGTTTGVPSSR